jgi:2',3'-cyclic-nucleotide 2'-phosphodiesterase/3'-nucleotidase
MGRSGELKISTSEDGRMLNIKSLKVYELINEGVLKLSSYIVELGDNLWVISEKHGMTCEELNRFNDLVKSCLRKAIL